MVKETLSGMGKEELMKFANDPFWVRLRWILFITFWLLWAAMLAGAIAIIVVAPKCAVPEPKKLWEESPIIQLDALDSPTVDLKGLESVLNDLKSQHIRAVSLSSLVKESANGICKIKKNIFLCNLLSYITLLLILLIFLLITLLSYITSCEIDCLF
jgi:solute carrier family 3 protein 2